MDLTFAQQLTVALAGGFVAALLTSVLNNYFESRRLHTQWQREREERQEQWAREETDRRRREALERLDEQFKPALEFADEAVRIVLGCNPQRAVNMIHGLSNKLWGFTLILADDPLKDQLLELLRYARIEETDERWKEYQGIVFNTCQQIAEMYNERRAKLDELDEG